MNILQINSVCGIGSTGRIASDLHATLISQGHKSTVAFGRDTAINCNHVIRIGSRLDNYLHAAKTRIFDKHGFGSVAATKNFIKRIIELNPDVIHLHNLHGYYLHIGLLFEYLKRANKPVIWTLHDCWTFTGHCAHFDFIECNKWKVQCHDCPSIRDYPTSFFIDHSTWSYHKKKELFTGIQGLTIVTPSKWLAELVKQSFLSEYPIKVINNGVDLSTFKPTPSAFRINHSLEDKFILLGVALSFGERKGYQFFLELSKHLKPNEKIVLVGLSEKQIKTLPAGIMGIARTNNATELAEIYSAADIFINPSLEDVFGQINIEALACGLPVVTFNSGGNPEGIDASCGLVVERGDLQGLVTAIASIGKNGKEFYTANCQKRAQDRFDKNARFAEYIELYQDYLK